MKRRLVDTVFVFRPIVHRTGGMLLQLRKEFVICADLKPDDVFFYYTTTCVSIAGHVGLDAQSYAAVTEDG